MVNWKKSDLVPSTHLQYLSMVIDTSLEQVFPSQDRLSQFKEVATSFLLLPSQPACMWQQLLSHMSSLERFLPEGTHSHATPPVANERPLVASRRWSSQPDPPVSGLYGGSQVVAWRGPMEAGGSSTHSVPIPVVIYQCVTVWMGSTSSRPRSLRSMVRRGVTGAYKRPGDEGSGAGPGVVPPPASRAECRPDERQRVCCRLSMALGRHSIP